MNLSSLLSDSGIAVGTLSLAVAIRTLLYLVIGLALIRILLNLVSKFVGRSHTLAPLSGTIHSALRVILYIVLMLVILGSLGVEVTSLIALLSVAGLSVSLALQTSLSNLAGGMMLLVSKPFAAGDFVGIDDIEGKVEAVGLSYTTLVTIDNKEVIIPNSHLSNTRIINYNRLGKRRIDLTFTASYDAPAEAVRRAIEEAIDSFPQVLCEPAPVVYVTEYGSSAISYLMRAWVSADDYWPVRYGITERVRDTFEKNNVEMTYDHLNVHMIP